MNNISQVLALYIFYKTFDACLTFLIGSSSHWQMNKWAVKDTNRKI